MEAASFDPRSAISRTFDLAMAEFLISPGLALIGSRGFSRAHYASVLREIYHYTKEDPQMQAYATCYFRGQDRHMVAPFLRHAISEVGHDQLALNDIRALGHSTDGIETSQPLPATMAFTAFGFYQITFGNPVSYLGYLYFLEFLPTQHGVVFKEALARIGVPEEALTFLRDHMTVDIGHNKAMEKYISSLVRDQADLDAVNYSMRVTAKLWANMLNDALARAECPADFGTSPAEARRTPAGSANLVEDLGRGASRLRTNCD